MSRPDVASDSKGLDPDEEPVWLRNARREIELRREIPPEEGALVGERRMLARLRSTYPDLPTDLRVEAEQLLRARWFTPEAWETAVSWLKTQGYSPGQPTT
jgi:hypothetical protein